MIKSHYFLLFLSPFTHQYIIFTFFYPHTLSLPRSCLYDTLTGHNLLRLAYLLIFLCFFKKNELRLCIFLCFCIIYQLAFITNLTSKLTCIYDYKLTLFRQAILFLFAELVCYCSNSISICNCSDLIF